MRLCLLIVLLSFSSLVAAIPDHSLLGALLAEHVRDGDVAYSALRSDPRLPAYLKQMAAIRETDLPDDPARLAYWINLYNAATLSLVCQHYPIKKITDLSTGGAALGFLLKRTVWDIRFVQSSDAKLTLNEIEHTILRKKFREPRLHFALVCAARGCPLLRSEAYDPLRLDAQFDDQARWFWLHRNSLDATAKRIVLSPILKWFADDFGPDLSARLTFLARFAPPEAAAALREAAAAPPSWKISYANYDWSLNDASPKSSP